MVQPVATWTFEPYIRNQSNSWSSTAHLLAAARRSIESMDRNLGRPRIYCDSLGRDILSELTDAADFEVTLDGIFDRVKPHVWILGKLMTYQQQTEPFLHFDLDLIYHRPITDSAIWLCDLCLQNIEPRDLDSIVEANCYNHSEIPELDLPQIFCRPDIDTVPAYNMGWYYCRNMEFNRSYAHTALDMIERNLDRLNHGEPRLHVCVIEQLTLGLMIKDRPDLRVETLIDIPRDRKGYFIHNFHHFHGYRKDHQDPQHAWAHARFLGPTLIDPKIQELAGYIDSLRENTNI